MCFLLIRTRNTELVEHQTCNIADQSGIYETIQDERRDKTFSEIKSPSTTDVTYSQSKVQGFTLSPCPAYLPVKSQLAARGVKDVKDEMNGVYETVNPA